MKKLLIASFMMLGFSAFVSAQTDKAKAAPAKAVAVSKPATTATTPPVAKPVTTAKAVSPSKPVKADGTPDMRYKENKTKVTPAKGPKKADGTPDMRYKENKPKGKS